MVMIAVIIIYMAQAGGRPGLLEVWRLVLVLLLLLVLERMERERVVLVDDLLLFIFMVFLFQRAGQTERLRVDSYHLLFCRLCFRVLPGDYSFCQKSAIYFFFFLVVDGFFGAGLPLIFAD